MTFDDATTTSRCVGRTDTVSCLLDTSWACVQRRNSKLCSKVYDRKSDHNDPPDFAALPQRRQIGSAHCRERVGQYVSYSVVGVAVEKKRKCTNKSIYVCVS